MNRRTTALLALILFAVVVVLLWRPSLLSLGDDRAFSSGASSTSPTRWSSGTSRVPSKLPRANHQSQNRHATHAPEELKDFIIPELKTENATVDEALAVLFEQYNEICHNTGERPLTFGYRIEGSPSSKLDLDLQQVSFLRALRIIAARSGLVVERDGTKLVFSPIQLEHAESLVTAQSPVPPTFLTDLNALFVTAPAAPEDPLAQPDPADLDKPGRSSIDSILNYPNRQASRPLIEQLRELGVVRSSDAAVSYLPASSILVLKSSAADQARLESFLDGEILTTTPVMFRTTTKFIESTAPLTFEKSRFSGEEFQEVMQSLTRTKGVSIMTQPSVITRPGQPGTIEVGREVVLLDPELNGDFTKDWVGTKSQVNSGGYGFDLQSKFTHEVREDMGDATPTIKGVTSDTSQHHPSGHTVLIESTSPGGHPFYIFSTTRRIDATGRPFDPRKPE